MAQSQRHLRSAEEHFEEREQSQNAQHFEEHFEERGDSKKILIVDNWRCLHSRDSVEDTKRTLKRIYIR